MEKEKYDTKFDVIVVGAGPSGVSAAITLAKANKKVLLIERGDYAGSKNMYGGIMYSHALNEIFPNFLNEAPIERITKKHNYFMMTEKEAVGVSYSDKLSKDDENICFTALRSKFDKWCVEEAQKAGVIYAPRTWVKNAIIKNNFVVGVKTEIEEIYGSIVIIADGANSLLAKEIGLRKDIDPKDVALAVKEVYQLDKNTINERFNLLNDKDGAMIECLGYPFNEILGLSFVYTNSDSVSVGVGITLDELAKNSLRPYDYLDQFKNHPEIAPLIKGGEMVEYSAHLIPEGGYKKIPKLYTNGAMVVGDAAMFINNVNFEGTNLALVSGQLAAKAAIVALDCNDVSKNTLKLYENYIKESFIYKDLKSYKNIMEEVKKRKKAFLDFYPKQATLFFKNFVEASGVEKRKVYLNFICQFFKSRSFVELFKDLFTLIKMFFGVFIKWAIITNYQLKQDFTKSSH